MADRATPSPEMCLHSNIVSSSLGKVTGKMWAMDQKRDILQAHDRLKKTKNEDKAKGRQMMDQEAQHDKPTTSISQTSLYNPNGKLVRLWTKDRDVKKRYAVCAESLKVLKMKGAEKLNLPNHKHNTIRIVLEDDGAEVDNSYFDNMQRDVCVILLHGGEEWEPVPEPAPLPITLPLQIYNDKRYELLSEKDKAIKLFQLMLQDPKVAAYFEMPELEIIKDADVEELGLPEINIKYAMQLQEMCITLYLKKTREADAMEFVELLHEAKFMIP